ncbi:MAG: nucleotidyl transferase AbiEii/AbiGii toxin family protein [Candidatus Micrarchaeota archaeon]
MIDKETLLKIAKLYKTRPWQQEKHYLQAIILTALTEEPVVFKGGTYLWFFHGLDRFSEDLDFTYVGKPKEELGKEVSEALRIFGVENTVKKIEAGERSVSFRISAKGPLNTSEKDLCHVYVEASLREQVIKPTLSLKLDFDAYGLPVKIVQGMSLDEVAAEKVRAIMTRDKARDAYDLAFLIQKRKATPDFETIDKKLAYYNLRFSKKSFEEKLSEKEKHWKTELKPMVFGDLPDFEAAAKTILKEIAAVH